MSGQQFGSIEHATETGKTILTARSYTSTPEIYDYLTSALAPWPTSLLHAHNELRIHAELGNMSMVRHLLHLGVPVQVSGGDFETPLVMACRGWHNDIVDLLLERGADPNFAPQELYPVLPLHESTTAGNLSLARKLLDHGAFPDRDGGCHFRRPALWWAFTREYTDMIQLLLERGASFDGVPFDGWANQSMKGWIGRSLAEYFSKKGGYDSMAEVLRRKHGF
jgi:ankyrin repeat protein